MTNKEAIEELMFLSKVENNNGSATWPIVSKPEQVEALKLAIKALKSKGPQGKWIYKRVDTQRCGNIHGCNICGQEVESFSTDYQNRPCAFNFCPNCGANMRGGKA